MDVYHADYPHEMVNWYGTPTRMDNQRLQEHLRGGDAMLHAQPPNSENNQDGYDFHVVHNDQIAQQANNSDPRNPSLFEQAFG